MSKDQNSTTAAPIILKDGRKTSVMRMIVLGGLLLACSAYLIFFQESKLSAPAVVYAMGILSSIGVMFILFWVAGFIQLTSIRNADEFARNLVDEMDTGLTVIDDNGEIIYANQAYGDLIGAQKPEEVKSVESVFSKQAEAAEVVYRLANAARAGNTSVEEFRLPYGLYSNGEGARWYRLRTRPIILPTRKKPATVWQVSDVTQDRKKHESAFLDLQNAINYLDHAPAGFMSSDPDGKLIYINATLADWLGIDLAMFKPGETNLQDIVVGDGIALLETANQKDQPFSTAIIDLDLLKSDGKSLPVRLYHRVSQNADASPGSSRTLVISRGIVADSEEELWASEVRFTRFFNNAPMAIAALNREGQIIRQNAPFQKLFAEISGQPVNKGMEFATMFDAEAHKTLMSAMEQAYDGQSIIDPVEIKIGDKQDRSVRFFITPVAGDTVAHDGELQSAAQNENAENGAGFPMDDSEERIVVYAMETTEQRLVEEQFAQSQKMQAVGQLAGGVAHDFNNVLTAIIGFSELLLNNHKPSDPNFQDIMNIKQNANRAASLVRQLLAFSRQQTLRPRVLDLAEVLSDLKLLLDRLLGEQVKLKVVHGKELWAVKADLSQFEQVIVNLAVNARDAMQDGGNLTFGTSNLTEEECRKRYDFVGLHHADFVLLEVEDEGSGIPPDTMKKIFDPFFSTKDVGKGTGLGLATVYGIIKQTGGYIFVESEVGKGTTFLIFLPRYEMDEDEEVLQVEDSAEVTKKIDLSGSARILLVEDEDAVRAFAERALKTRGYEVTEAVNGQDAMDILEDEDGNFDLVVSDVVMPEMDGPSLFNAARVKYPNLKFVFVSGYAEDAFAKNLPDSENEEFGFLPKPYSLKQLATTVKEMLNQ